MALVYLIIVEFMIIMLVSIAAAVLIWKFRRDAGADRRRADGYKALLVQYELEKYKAAGVDRPAEKAAAK